ncbi:MAG: RNA 3'-terminal phosphate cyclase, partial [Nanoarchaeota archaeon]
IDIDGSHDEGGGQILRTAAGLSAYTGKPFRIFNIRGKRTKPGIRHQHLEAIGAVARLCNAEVKGNVLNSKELEFIPHELGEGRLNIRIPTAGSAALVLQSLMIPALKTTVKVKIEGGATYGKWAPSMDYLANVLFPMLNKMGYNIAVEKLKDGFYPKGGALIEVTIKRSELKPMDFIERGKLKLIKGISVASSNLEKARVAERQAMSAKKTMFDAFSEYECNMQALYRDSICPGTGITLWAEFENTRLGADALGELGKKSESVGREAALALIKEFNTEAVVDLHAADQLLPYIAIAGKGRLKTSKITGHVRTNIAIIEKFLGVKFKVSEEQALVEL